MLPFKSTQSTLIFGSVLGLTLMTGVIHSKEFNPKPFAGSDESLRQTLIEQVAQDNDELAQVQLGRLYSLYNHLDEAKDILSKVVEKDSKNADALVWLGVTNTKLAANAIPWDMGIRKLYLVKKGLRQIDEAVALDGNNFDVLITSIITGAKIKKFGALEKSQVRIKPLLAGVDEPSKGYTSDAKAAIYLAASHVAISEGNKVNAKKFSDSAKSQNPEAGIRWQIDELASLIPE